MTIDRFRKAISLSRAAVFLMAATATASTITFNTNAAGTGFGGGSLTLNNSSGVAATLTFIPALDSVTGTPSNVNLGNFTLVCLTCSTQAGGVGSVFDPFTFDLVVTDVTAGATGKFVGTSTGGSIFSDVSTIAISWAPLELGPGTANALTGNFGPTIFSTTIFTGIVAPNSGAVPGQTTMQGVVSFIPVPEPAAFTLIGGALLGLGFLRTKRRLAGIVQLSQCRRAPLEGMPGRRKGLKCG